MPITVNLTLDPNQFQTVTPNPPSNGQFKSESMSLKQHRNIVLIGNPGKKYLSSEFTGLLGLFCEASRRGLPATLRPDDIWIPITTCMGSFINDHAEDLRYIFVDHEGRKILKIGTTADSIYQLTQEHLSGLVGSFNSEIKKNLKQDVVDWFSPSLSTSDLCDTASNSISAMGAFEKYFEYVAGCQGAQGPSEPPSTYRYGLTTINFEGDLEDWKKLREHAIRLESFFGEAPQTKCDLSYFKTWSQNLITAINAIMDVFKGKIDPNFWNDMFTYTVRAGDTAMVEGWALAFCPFDRNGSYPNIMKDTQLFNCQAEAPVKFVFYDNPDNNCQVKVRSGIMGYSYENGSLRPIVNWVFYDPIFEKNPLSQENHHLIDIVSQKDSTTEDIERVKKERAQNLEGPQGSYNQVSSLKNS